MLNQSYNCRIPSFDVMFWQSLNSLFILSSSSVFIWYSFITFCSLAYPSLMYSTQFGTFFDLLKLAVITYEKTSKLTFSGKNIIGALEAMAAETTLGNFMRIQAASIPPYDPPKAITFGHFTDLLSHPTTYPKYHFTN